MYRICSGMGPLREAWNEHGDWSATHRLPLGPPVKAFPILLPVSTTPVVRLRVFWPAGRELGVVAAPARSRAND
jgi:hypothetical protein